MSKGKKSPKGPKGNQPSAQDTSGEGSPAAPSNAKGKGPVASGEEALAGSLDPTQGGASSSSAKVIPEQEAPIPSQEARGGGEDPQQPQEQQPRQAQPARMADVPGDTDDRRRPPRFSGKDWWTWSFRFEQWAVSKDLQAYYDGTAGDRPAAAGDAQRKWDKGNQMAFAELCNALEPDELIRLVREFGAKRTITPGNPPVVATIPARPTEAWERLDSFFVQRQLSSRIIIERQLNNLKMEKGESAGAYWARADELRQKFAAAGGKQDPQSWMGKVIAGLPREWETLKVVLNGQFASLTEPNLLLSLTGEEERRAEQAQQEQQETAAAMAAWSSKGGSSKGKGGQGRHSTNQGGGKASTKTIGRDGEWGQLGKAPSGHCHGCHKKGHDWRECYSRPKDAIPEFMKQRGKGNRGRRGDANAADDVSPGDVGDIAMVEAVGSAPQPWRLQCSRYEGTRGILD